jgi:hypothetical protein
VCGVGGKGSARQGGRRAACASSEPFYGGGAVGWSLFKPHLNNINFTTGVIMLSCSLPLARTHAAVFQRRGEKEEAVGPPRSGKVGRGKFAHFIAGPERPERKKRTARKESAFSPGPGPRVFALIARGVTLGVPIFMAALGRELRS